MIAIISYTGIKFESIQINNSLMKVIRSLKRLFSQYRHYFAEDYVSDKGHKTIKENYKV